MRSLFLFLCFLQIYIISLLRYFFNNKEALECHWSFLFLICLHQRHPIQALLRADMGCKQKTSRDCKHIIRTLQKLQRQIDNFWRNFHLCHLWTEPASLRSLFFFSSKPECSCAFKSTPRRKNREKCSNYVSPNTT